MKKMTTEELVAKLEWEGWDYILTEINPNDLADAGLAEALEEARIALRGFKALLPSFEDLDEDDYALAASDVEELDFDY